MVLLKLGYQKRQNSSERYPQFGHRPQNCSSALFEVEQFLTNKGFKGRRIIILPNRKLLQHFIIQQMHKYIIRRYN